MSARLIDGRRKQRLQRDLRRQMKRKFAHHFEKLRSRVGSFLCGNEAHIRGVQVVHNRIAVFVRMLLRQKYRAHFEILGFVSRVLGFFTLDA